MVDGMARQGWAQRLKRLAAVAVLAAGVPLGVAAQQAQPPETPPSPPAGTSEPKPESTLPPISRECQVGATQVVSQTPLPNVERALRERQRIAILVIGASPVALRNSGTGGHYELVEKLLENTFKGLEVTVVHRGVSGELARDAGERIKMEVALLNPDLVLWQVGTADALSRMSPEDFEESVAETLVWLRGHGVDVALIGLHYIKALTKDPNYQAIRASLKRMAAEHGIMRIGRYEAGETITRLRREQGKPLSSTALTEAAYECSAEYLSRAIASGLFLKTRGTKPPSQKK
jgi:acyl-CoA thioesterase I